MPNVLIIGSAIADITIRLSRLPLSGEDIEGSKETYDVGGCALNVACVLKAFNINFTAFLPIGSGFYGKMIEEKLDQINIHSCIKGVQGDNGHCYTFIEDSKERSFVTLSGIEAKFESNWFSKLKGRDFSYAYISGYSLLGESGLNIINYLETLPSCKIIFAPGPRIDAIDPSLLEKIYKASAIIHLNEDELKICTGCSNISQGISQLHQKTNELVVVTLGAKGAMFISQNKHNIVSGEKGIVVNTSGAGDAHVGGVIVGLVQNIPLNDIICQANKVAMKVVSQEDTKY